MNVLIIPDVFGNMLVTNISMKNKVHEQTKRFFEAMNAMHRVIGGKRQSAFKRVGLSRQQIEVLYFLGSSECRTIKEIAASLDSTSSAATQVVAGLEQAKIVERHPDKKDRRVVQVHLTPLGKKKLVEFKKVHLKNLEKMMQVLSDQERELLISIPSKLIKYLNK